MVRLGSLPQFFNLLIYRVGGGRQRQHCASDPVNLAHLQCKVFALCLVDGLELFGQRAALFEPDLTRAFSRPAAAS